MAIVRFIKGHTDVRLHLRLKSAYFDSNGNLAYRPGHPKYHAWRTKIEQQLEDEQ